ncbi:MAG: CdaR family protein, partial [Oscillospiraceae bacterium]|nr:CdaR family protein [Oscillospiraceae bacterium]
ETVNLTLVDENGEAVRSADLSISESEVTATLEVLTEKEIPLTLSILPGGGASEDNTEITYSRETVLLRGEKSRLDELTELNVGELALGMIEQDTTLTYEITAPEKTQLVSPDDKLDVSVVFRGLDRADFTISSFLSEHADTNAEEGLQARVLTQTLRVTLRGPAALLEELQDTDLTAVADLTDYTKPGVFTVPVVIRTPDESVGAVGEYTVELELYVEE